MVVHLCPCGAGSARAACLSLVELCTLRKNLQGMGGCSEGGLDRTVSREQCRPAVVAGSVHGALVLYVMCVLCQHCCLRLRGCGVCTNLSCTALQCVHGTNPPAADLWAGLYWGLSIDVWGPAISGDGILVCSHCLSCWLHGQPGTRLGVGAFDTCSPAASPPAYSCAGPATIQPATITISKACTTGMHADSLPFGR